MQNSDNKSPLPNPLQKDYLLTLRFPIRKNFSLPLPLPNGSEKATPANAYCIASFISNTQKMPETYPFFKICLPKSPNLPL
jgi:hypothetical protein